MFSQRVDEVMQRLRAAVARTGIAPQDIFARLDVNGDGILSCEEVLALFVQLQGDLSAAERRGIFLLLDQDGNGQVDVNEFSAMFEDTQRNSCRLPAQRSQRPLSAHAQHVIQRLAISIARIGVEPRDLFRKLDTNADRNLSLDELNRLIMQFHPELTLEETRAIFEHFDLDGSGLISAEEFSQTLACAVLDAAGGRNPAAAHHDEVPSRVDGLINRLQSALARTGLNPFDLFSQLDVNNDGQMSLAELARLALQLQPDMSQVEMQLLFRKIDADGSGVIDRHEFCAIFTMSTDHYGSQRCGMQQDRNLGCNRGHVGHRVASVRA